MGSQMTVSLGSLIDFQNGFAFKSKEYADTQVEGCEVLRMGYIARGGGFKEDDKPVFAPLDSKGNQEKYRLQVNDLVMAMTDMKNNVAILGCVAFIKDSGRFLLNQRVGRLRVKNELDTNPRFLYYLLNSPEVLEDVRSRANSGVQVNLTTTGVLETELSLPERGIQDYVAQILGTLDDKIELNQKMNQTLEEIAKAIFKSWFVDFDPVRAKAEGRPTGLPPEISDLFPEELVDTEIGEIPRGWHIGSISDFAFLNRETVNPSQSSVMYEHFSIPAFDSGQSPVLDLGTDIKSNKTLVVEGSLLVSKLNPNTPRVWLPNPKKLYEQICSTEFMVYTATDRSNIAFLWGLFTSSLVAERMEAMVTGTSKSHQRVKPNDVSNITTVIPDTRLIKTYGDTILPMLNRTLIGKTESGVVAEVRDTLLPKLISGELRIPDAEKFLEEAGI